jgi:biotin synthase-like enzyme
MGKLRDNYNKCKPTKRQIKKQTNKINDTNRVHNMCQFLENKWHNTITYTCGYCLQEAYYSELNNTQGYITDEELITSSNYKLKHK